jgi:ubiquinone/menaquinone biosynthesis C-methylase UbiE
MKDKNRVCPVEIAGSLDNSLRRFLQNPLKLLSPFVNKGMSVLDIGCGPGFFSVALAELVGNSGKVFAADIQDGMLDRLRNKIEGTSFKERIILHKCEADKIGIQEKVDFILAFFMVHEVPDKQKFFNELKTLIKTGGTILIVEPKYFHVSGKDFKSMIELAGKAGFNSRPAGKFFLCQSVLLNN